MTMLRYLFLALTVAAVAAPDFALAQAKKGNNGGPIVVSQGHPIEFVRRGLDIVFYVGDDDGSPLPTKDMKGRATIQDAGKTFNVALTPGAPNMMVGKLPAELSSQARVVFSATLHGHSLTARYAAQ
jgi:hypothetical protein